MTSPLKKPRRSVSSTRRAPQRPSGTHRRVAAQEVPVTDEPLVMPDEGTQSWFQQGIVLPQHKRQLILAHAEARKARRMPHKWVYLMGVVASCLVVMTGWWFTVGSWIQGQLTYASQPGIQQEVQQQIGRLEEAYPVAKPSLADAKAALNPLSASAATTTIDKTSSR